MIRWDRIIEVAAFFIIVVLVGVSVHGWRAGWWAKDVGSAVPQKGPEIVSPVEPVGRGREIAPPVRREPTTVKHVAKEKPKPLPHGKKVGLPLNILPPSEVTECKSLVPATSIYSSEQIREAARFLDVPVATIAGMRLCR